MELIWGILRVSMQKHRPLFFPQKRVPERTCVSCRAIMPKSELMRLVRTVDNEIRMDLPGKGRGRGAYLCSSPSCWIEGIMKGKLERALRIKMDERNRQWLLEQVDNLHRIKIKSMMGS